MSVSTNGSGGFVTIDKSQAEKVIVRSLGLFECCRRRESERSNVAKSVDN